MAEFRHPVSSGGGRELIGCKEFQEYVEQASWYGRVLRLQEAIKDAEAQLTAGTGSPECAYALGILRAALRDSE